VSGQLVRPAAFKSFSMDWPTRTLSFRRVWILALTDEAEGAGIYMIC
jgi:hypothetical protein